MNWNEVEAMVASSPQWAAFGEFVALAAADPEVGKLHVHASHGWLGFSEDPEYPFKDGFPYVRASPGDSAIVFVVANASPMRELGRGTAREALDMVKAKP